MTRTVKKVVFVRFYEGEEKLLAALNELKKDFANESAAIKHLLATQGSRVFEGMTRDCKFLAVRALCPSEIIHCGNYLKTEGKDTIEEIAGAVETLLVGLSVERAREKTGLNIVVVRKV